MKILRFGSIYSIEAIIFHFLCFFKKHDFELNKLKRVTIWIDKSTMRYSFNQEKIQLVRFWIKKIQRVRFWKKTFDRQTLN